MKNLSTINPIEYLDNLEKELSDSAEWLDKNREKFEEHFDKNDIDNLINKLRDEANIINKLKK